jgi:hypothetical protein
MAAKRHKAGKGRTHRVRTKPKAGVLTEYRAWLRRTSRTDNPGARRLFLKQRDSSREGMKPGPNLARIKAVVSENRQTGRQPYAGLDSSEIGTYNRALMFGDEGEAFPGQAAWSRLVD